MSELSINQICRTVEACVAMILLAVVIHSLKK
jgi:hypothetical protein